jgi:hypothetical protein
MGVDRTEDEILSAVDAQAAYAEYEERENRRLWWDNLLYSVCHPLQSLHWSLCKRGWFRPRVTDDEIPF